MNINDLKKHFVKSDDFLRLRLRTREGYLGVLKPFFESFGETPLKETNGKRFLHRYKRFLKTFSENGGAKLARHVRIVFYYALREMLVKAAPIAKVKIRSGASRPRKVWTQEDFAVYYDAAPDYLKKYLLFAKDTGLRQGDLLTLRYRDIIYHESRLFFKVRQQKTGTYVYIPLTRKIKTMIDEKRIGSRAFILTGGKGRILTASAVHSARARLRKKLKREKDGLTFGGLRPTRCVALARRGLNEIEIASLMGWSINTARSMMDRHYLVEKISVAARAATRLGEY